MTAKIIAFINYKGGVAKTTTTYHVGCSLAHPPWRKVKVTERRAARDYAQCMRDLADIHYPDAEIIRVVQDNLSTPSAGALYQAFPPAEARRIEFHYTPKHASWLNMVEIEIGVLRGQCLDRRMDDPKPERRINTRTPAKS